MRSIGETILGLDLCREPVRECGDCPYCDTQYCEDALREDAAAWLRRYEAELSKGAQK